MIGIDPPLVIRFSEKCDLIRVKTSPLFEFAHVLVRLDHVAPNLGENGQRVSLRYTIVSKLDIAKLTQAVVSQANWLASVLLTFRESCEGEITNSVSPLCSVCAERGPRS